MSLLDKEIKAAYADVKRNEKHVHRLEFISTRILEQEILLAELEQQKDKELNDIETLQKGSIKDIFQYFLGKREDALNIEKQEFLWAQLNYLACKRRIKALKIEKAAVEKEIIQHKVAEKYLNDLLVRKERKIKKSVKEFAEYKSLTSRVLQREHLLREINEAQGAGISLIEKISDLKIQLAKIQKQDTWGAMDRSTARKYHGKGNYSSFEKKQFTLMNQEILYDIDIQILKFKSELDDIHSNFELDYTRHLTILAEFIPIFYDNLITDWVVQREIINAQRSTNIIFSRVERILLMLKHEYSTVVNELDYYQLKRRKYLLDE